ncbi:hypothetical protein AKJ57_04610 [candidate division MSBL1 archaeon SCGC-AAA259A05]|uniref:Alcohol dehydrogenase iron-type/glycerol dehydrogenase GldA domain-containing protein n=1 Tax=candidate division MSBL1 archaeon SCGC-AAA259A05 TaxID=1698259 RepID=A0A133U733_9EURY|nr:hypothetical protein AKJ57_04610 [candidate division MSBL1 archaeon SCGC-AAA259A05]
MQFKHETPKTRLIFGRGNIRSLGEEAAKYGNRALLVTGKSSMERLGFLDEAMNSLTEVGVEVIHYGGVRPNPTIEMIDRGAELALEKNCEVIIALGGGSP